jgi:hypothetical protein
VTDPSAHDPLTRLLAFGHPLWMSVSIAIAVFAARSGLQMRNARRLGTRRNATTRSRHLRTAKLAVALIAIGFTSGPLSMALLRGRDPFETAHAWIATLALGLFATAALIGRRLERGRSQARDVHALVAALALLAAGVAAMTGWVLLP